MRGAELLLISSTDTSHKLLTNDKMALCYDVSQDLIFVGNDAYIIQVDTVGIHSIHCTGVNLLCDIFRINLLKCFLKNKSKNA